MRMAGSVISDKVTRWVVSTGRSIASATCQAIASPSRSRREVVLYVDPELALAGVLRKVADVPI